MKKILISFFISLFISISFSDTIVKKNGEKILDVNILYSSDDKLYYSPKMDETLTKFIFCSAVSSIYNNEDKKIDYKCGKMRRVIDKSSAQFQNKTMDNKFKLSFGGAFIAIGSFMVYNTLDTEYESMDDLEDLNEQQKLGFLFIAIGGGLIAIGV